MYDDCVRRDELNNIINDAIKEFISRDLKLELEKIPPDPDEKDASTKLKVKLLTVSSRYGFYGDKFYEAEYAEYKVVAEAEIDL